MDISKIAGLLQQIVNELNGGTVIIPPVVVPPVSSKFPILTDDRIKTLQRMKTDNHKWWNDIKAAADRTATNNPVYDDIGQFAAIVYRVTGDKSYATISWNTLYKNVSGNIGPIDNVREYFIKYLTIFSWIRDAITADQVAQFNKAITVYGDISLGNLPAVKTGGFNFSDSDQTLGQFGGIAILSQLKLDNRDWINEKINAGSATGLSVGGLTATTSIDRTSARQTIRQYLDLAKGGCWFESSNYNDNTCMLLLELYWNMYDLTGVDYFPEVTAWIPDCCNDVFCSFLSDLTSTDPNYEWGDEERTHTTDLYKRLPFLAALQYTCERLNNLTLAGKILDLINGLLAVQPTTNIRAQFYYFINPYVAKFSFKDTPRVSFSPNIGIVKRVESNQSFYVNSPSRLRVDHENEELGNINWNFNGEWLIRNPLGYSPILNTSVGVNSIMFCGLSTMLKKGIIDYESTPDYLYVVCQTGGPIYDPNEWKSPAEFVHEGTRTILYLPSLNITAICDRMNVSDVKEITPDLIGYLNPDKQRIANAKRRKEIVWHMPVAPTVDQNSRSITWPTKNGVKLTAFNTQNDLRIDTYVESDLWVDISSLDKTEKKYHVRVGPSIDKQWDCILTLIQAGNNIDTSWTPVQDSKVGGFASKNLTILFGADPLSRIISMPASPLSGCYYVGADSKKVIKT